MTEQWHLRQRVITRLEETDLTIRNWPKLRAVREKQETKLYSVNIVEQNPTTHKVKIHYIGYDSCATEWRDEGDIVNLSEAQPRHLLSSNYNLYQELALSIKASLHSPRKENLR